MVFSYQGSTQWARNDVGIQDIVRELEVEAAEQKHATATHLEQDTFAEEAIKSLKTSLVECENRHTDDQRRQEELGQETEKLERKAGDWADVLQCRVRALQQFDGLEPVGKGASGPLEADEVLTTLGPGQAERKKAEMVEQELISKVTELEESQTEIKVIVTEHEEGLGVEGESL